ncbi:MAG: ASKHA domain-containing protein [Pseudomonadota bacterium]
MITTPGNGHCLKRSLPRFQALRLRKGQGLAEALSEAGFLLRSDCGGTGKCGQCRVRLRTGGGLAAPTAAETAHLTPLQLKNGYRLACQARALKTGTVAVRIDDDGLVRAPVTVNRAACRRLRGAVGVAIDLGTSRVEVALCDLDTGALLASAAGENAQRRHGDDVISRIAAAGDPAIGLERMQRLAVESVNRLIFACLEAGGIGRAAIGRVSLAGNTAMTLIFAGIDPGTLGRYPYRPAVTELPLLTAGALGLDMRPEAPVVLFPAVSGFIGGDTVSALLADGAFERSETCLIVDIGTNGELVLCRGGCILAASCATGPAFEGARISCGMPAVAGAIDRMDIDPAGRRFVWHVVDTENGALPEGLCGSGIVDAVAGLLRIGVLSPGGLLDRGSPMVSKIDVGGVRVTLVEAEKTGHGRPLVLSQKDIGELQLAKAAICAGIELLLIRSGAERIDHTVLTGAFGAGFNCRNAVAIGMLPEAVLAGTVTARAGLVAKGALMALTEPDIAARALALSRRIDILELGGDAQFAEHFVAAMAFPEPATKSKTDGLP